MGCWRRDQTAALLLNEQFDIEVFAVLLDPLRSLAQPVVVPQPGSACSQQHEDEHISQGRITCAPTDLCSA